MSEEMNVNLGADAGTIDTQNQAMNQVEQETKTYTQKELDALLQSESDRRVNQALSTFKEKELPKLINSAKTEAQALAAMSEKERAVFEDSRKEEALRQRESALVAGELRLAAHKILSEKSLPVELIDCLVYTSAEQCHASIDGVAKAFNRAVEARVNDQLRRNPPKGVVEQQQVLDAQLNAAFGN